jgi:hypothetical protein
MFGEALTATQTFAERILTMKGVKFWEQLIGA